MSSNIGFKSFFTPTFFNTFSPRSYTLYDIVCVCTLSCVQLFCDPLGLKPTRFLCPWDFPGKSNGVCCYFLFQGISLTHGWDPQLLGLLHTGTFSPTVPPGKPIYYSTGGTKQSKPGDLAAAFLHTAFALSNPWVFLSMPRRRPVWRASKPLNRYIT